MTKSQFKLGLYGALFLILLYVLFNIAFMGGGYFFWLEMLGVVVILVLALAGFIWYKTWGENVLFFAFLLYLLNLVGLWYVNAGLNIFALALALIGVMISIPQCSCKTAKKESGEAHSEVFDPVVRESKEAPQTQSAAKPETKFTPGKYVASKSSNVYHEPKCDWAKKIRKPSQVWFNSKEEAVKQGYKAHSCLK